MKWGVRNGPPYPLNSSDPSMYNIDKLGTSSKNNILYITGLSGSGKSTYAEKYKKPKECVHLDGYFEQDTESAQNLNLNEFLKENDFDISKMRKDGEPNKEKRWKNIDKFAEELLPKYAEKKYSEGKIVIAEGVQLLDDTMYPNKTYFKDKPIVILNTNQSVAMYRAIARDNIKTDAQDMAERLEWYSFFNTKINELKETINI